MGLTNQSTGTNALDKDLNIIRTSDNKIIALAGNPNVGKSTIFNSLTGLNQHTGNWPGKTVTNATGKCIHINKDFVLVDIPGTYSLMAHSAEEEVARDFICFGNPDATIVIMDATCLERNLNLVLQTLEITSNVIVCVNLMDEAKRKGILINIEKLSSLLGVSVVGTSASINKGLDKLMDEVYNITFNKVLQMPIKMKYDTPIEKALTMIQEKLLPYLKGKINTRWTALKLLENDESLLNSLNDYLEFNLSEKEEILHSINKAKEYLLLQNIDTNTLKDMIVSTLIKKSEDISKNVVTFSSDEYNATDRKIDKILTSKTFGIPLMILLLGIIFWITIAGANVPSDILASGLFWVQDRLTEFFVFLGTPPLVEGILVQGIYRTLAWVISVMLHTS